MLLQETEIKDFFDTQYKIHLLSSKLIKLENRLFGIGMRALGFKPKKAGEKDENKDD